MPEVVVVGGGAIGVCCAYDLAKRGLEVTLLERGATLAAGCSAGNAGLICPSHSAPLANPDALRQGLRWLGKRDSPFALRPRPAALPWLARFAMAATAARAAAGARVIRELSLASLALHAELAESGLDTGLRRRGTLSVYETEEALARAGGERLSPEEARRLEPALRGAIAGAVYHADEAHCDPLAFVNAVGDAAREAGADVRTGVELRRLRRLNGGLEMETSEGTLRPRQVVLAAGAWTSRLARQVGVFVPLEGGKGYHVDLQPTEADPRIPLFMQEARTIATPLAGRLRLSGTMELAGLDLRIDAVRAAAVRRSCERVLGADGSRGVLEVWAGLRPCTPDGLPVIGVAAPGLVLATGHAMKGLSLAPVTGRLIGQLVVGETPELDLRPFSPARFRRWRPR